MSDASATPRYRLTTFGTLALAASDETVLGKHRHQHRRLALLAVLAAAGAQGRSRDQLLALFWPDATQAQARHSLDQLLYALRNSLGESAFASGNPVRLDPDVLSSDVAAFNAAIERGDAEAAVQEYRGPFLDGFYLTDAPEFERWVDAERARLAGRYGEAVEHLARRAASAQDHASEIRWWRQLAESDPLSSSSAARVIRALLSAGDHAAALRYAEQHQALVAQELGIPAGPAIAELIAEARAGATPVPVSASQPPPLPQSAQPPAAIARTAPVLYDPMPGQPRLEVRSRRRRSPFLVAALAAAVVIIAVAAWRTASANKRRSPVGSSIAVLPLVNVSRDTADVAFVDGLTEDLIAALARIPGLRVIAPTSSFAFRNSDVDVRRIADSLGVSNLLEGSAQRAGSQLRVRVRLVGARDGSTRWVETYNRELRDVFAVQSDIADGVARELDLRFGASSRERVRRGPTSNIAAYELYLRGDDPALTRSDSGARAGVAYFRRAIELDPGYAAAYAGVARMELRLDSGGEDTTMSHRDRLALAEQSARRAVALDDADGNAHAALSLVIRSEYDFATSETEIKRAVALEPTNARFHEWLAQLYVWTDRPALALAEARQAVLLDPLSPTANAELARALFANDRCDEALSQLAKLRYLRPPLLRAGSIAAQCYARAGNWDLAVAALQRISPNTGLPGRGFLGYMLARAGRTEDARRILTDLRDHSSGRGKQEFALASVYAGLGERDEAFRWLEKAREDRAIDLEQLHTILDGLRPDRRVDGFVAHLGVQKR